MTSTTTTLHMYDFESTLGCLVGCQPARSHLLTSSMLPSDSDVP